jgi:hypothetical protein
MDDSRFWTFTLHTSIVGGVRFVNWEVVSKAWQNALRARRISFQRQKSIVIKESEELFVESEEMEIYSQTGPTFPEFDRRYHPNIVSGHHFFTSILIPIPITHTVQFKLSGVVQIGNEVPEVHLCESERYKTNESQIFIHHRNLHCFPRPPGAQIDMDFWFKLYLGSDCLIA